MGGMTDDDYLGEDFTDWKFHSLLCELEANGEILKQWENGEPDEKEPKTETETKNNE